MEFSSSYIGILEKLASERDNLLLVFIFGVMAVLLGVCILLAILKRIGAHQFIITPFVILSLTLFLSLFIGMITQMLLFFIGVSGIKMILIWGIMFLMILCFIIYDYQTINSKIKKNMKPY